MKINIVISLVACSPFLFSPTRFTSVLNFVFVRLDSTTNKKKVLIHRTIFHTDQWPGQEYGEINLFNIKINAPLDSFTTAAAVAAVAAVAVCLFKHCLP